MKQALYKILALAFLLLWTFSCTKEKESCLNCNTYNMFDFDGELEDYTGEFKVCENDDMWDDIVWGEYNHNDAGDFSFIDLDIYTLGYRTVENNDIDNDGILNQYDNDIDNDGINNSNDTTPYGIEDNSMLELIICLEHE